MGDGRRVNRDCPRSVNPYHECSEDCNVKIANGKPRKSSKHSGHQSGGNEIVQRVPKERRARRLCPKAANPYHECGDHCFENGSRVYPSLNRKQTRSTVADAYLEEEKKPERITVQYSGPLSLTRVETEVQYPTSFIDGQDLIAREAIQDSPNSSTSEDSYTDYDDEHDNDDDVLSIVSESRVPVGNYHVNPSLAPTLTAILQKYGDIAEKCQLESAAIRSYYLESACRVVQDIQSTESLMNLTKTRVGEMISIVNDLESAHIKIGWLRSILDETSDIVELASQHRAVRSEMGENDRAVGSARREMEALARNLARKEEEVLELKGRAAESEERVREIEKEGSELDRILSGRESRVGEFRVNWLMQELLP